MSTCSAKSYYSNKVKYLLEMDHSNLLPSTQKHRDSNDKEKTIRRWARDEYVKLNTLSYCKATRREVTIRQETVV